MTGWRRQPEDEAERQRLVRQAVWEQRQAVMY